MHDIIQVAKGTKKHLFLSKNVLNLFTLKDQGTRLSSRSWKKIDGNNSIISIGDGNLIAEYRLANSNLKVMISKLRKQLRQETIRRKEMEAEVFKLRQKLSLDI